MKKRLRSVEDGMEGRGRAREGMVCIEVDRGSRFRKDIQWGHDGEQLENDIGIYLLERWTDGDGGG